VTTTDQQQGPEYAPCTQCGHIEPEHRPDAGPCLLCDCWEYSRTEDQETARQLLWRHGLPEDIIDGALCLHAQELAAAIREETRRLKADGVLEPEKYRPCRDAANQIDPTRNEDDVDPDDAAPAVPAGQAPATDQAALLPAIGVFATLVRQRADHLEAALNRMRDRLEVNQVHEERHRLALSEALDLGAGAPWDAIHERVAELRRVAAEAGPADTTTQDDGETPGETEAHAPTFTWKVESPRRDNWASWGATYDDRDWARERYESATTTAPGRPFRLVRATTTYAVEAEHEPSAETQDAPPVEPHPTEADQRHALAVLARFHGRDTEQPAAAQQPKEA